MSHLVLLAVRRIWFVRLFAVCCAALLALGAPLTGHATVTGCRGDPMLVLGHFALQSSVDIAADIEAVDRVEYVYYLPQDTNIAVFYDDTALVAKETVTIIRQPGLLNARVVITVSLKPGLAPVGVAATTTFTNNNTGASGTRTVSGLSGQPLTIAAR